MIGGVLCLSIGQTTPSYYNYWLITYQGDNVSKRLPYNIHEWQPLHLEAQIINNIMKINDMEKCLYILLGYYLNAFPTQYMKII